MHDTMMSLLLILAILVLGLYFTLILVFDKSRVSLYATPLTTMLKWTVSFADVLAYYTCYLRTIPLRYVPV